MKTKILGIAILLAMFGCEEPKHKSAFIKSIINKGIVVEKSKVMGMVLIIQTDSDVVKELVTYEQWYFFNKNDTIK